MTEEKKLQLKKGLIYFSWFSIPILFCGILFAVCFPYFETVMIQEVNAVLTSFNLDSSIESYVRTDTLSVSRQTAALEFATKKEAQNAILFTLLHGSTPIPLLYIRNQLDQQGLLVPLGREYMRQLDRIPEAVLRMKINLIEQSFTPINVTEYRILKYEN